MFKTVVDKHEDRVQDDDRSNLNFKCKKCDHQYQSKTNLNDHIKTQHPRAITCERCDMVFDENCSYEKHMTTHDVEKEFKCDECGHKFHLEWRLKKHKASHADKNQRKCHFFNNDEHCPFADIGCKFAHVLSDLCLFKENCVKKMCSFRHK